MVHTKVVKLIMNPGELAIRLEKGWIMRDSLIQQIGGLEEIPSLKGIMPGEQIFGAAIKIEGGEIGCRWSLNGQLSQPVRFWREGGSATFCAISLWTANRSFRSRSYSSAQTCASVRASINCALM